MSSKTRCLTTSDHAGQPDTAVNLGTWGALATMDISVTQTRQCIWPSIRWNHFGQPWSRRSATRPCAQVILAAPIQEATRGRRSVAIAVVDQSYTGDQSVADAESLRLDVVKLSPAKPGVVLLPCRWIVKHNFVRLWKRGLRRVRNLPFSSQSNIPDLSATTYCTTVGIMLLCVIRVICYLLLPSCYMAVRLHRRCQLLPRNQHFYRPLSTHCQHS